MDARLKDEPAHPVHLAQRDGGPAVEEDLLRPPPFPASRERHRDPRRGLELDPEPEPGRIQLQQAPPGRGAARSAARRLEELVAELYESRVRRLLLARGPCDEGTRGRGGRRPAPLRRGSGADGRLRSARGGAIRGAPGAPPGGARAPRSRPARATRDEATDPAAPDRSSAAGPRARSSAGCRDRSEPPRSGRSRRRWTSAPTTAPSRRRPSRRPSRCRARPPALRPRPCPSSARPPALRAAPGVVFASSCCSGAGSAGGAAAGLATARFRVSGSPSISAPPSSRCPGATSAGYRRSRRWSSANDASTSARVPKASQPNARATVRRRPSGSTRRRPTATSTAQPRPARCTGLGKAQHQRHQRERADAPAEQPRGGEREHQDEKEVQERPPLDPRPLHLVHPGGAEQAPARWQVRQRPHPGEVVRPGHRGKAAASVVHPSVGGQGQQPLADLDPGWSGGPEPGQRLVLPLHRRPPERGRAWHLQAPAPAQLSAEPVLERPPAPVGVEPELPVQRELVRLGLGVAPPLLDQPERLARPHGEGRERPPLGRQLRLRGVHRGERPPASPPAPRALPRRPRSRHPRSRGPPGPGGPPTRSARRPGRPGGRPTCRVAAGPGAAPPAPPAPPAARRAGAA